MIALHPDFGAEIDDIDLREPLPDEVRVSLRRALWKHSLLVFRGQPLSNADVERVGSHLGARQSRVKRFEAAGPAPDQPWHCVGAITGSPAVATVLCARSAPREGGGMAFVSTRAPLQALPKDEQERLAGLTALHTFRGSPGSVEKYPLVVAYPQGAQPSLFLGYHVRGIEGLPGAESEKLVDVLMTRTTQARAIYRHDFRAGDVLIWDNGSLMHRACALAAGESRIVEEIAIYPHES